MNMVDLAESICMAPFKETCQCGRFDILEWCSFANNCQGAKVCSSCTAFFEDMKADADMAEHVEREA